VGKAGVEGIERRRLCEADGVVRHLGAFTEAVEDREKERAAARQ
jgi:hypothetical protein